MVDPKFDQSCITLETLAVLCARGLPGRCCLARSYVKYDGLEHDGKTGGAMRCEMHCCGSLFVLGISFTAQQSQLQIPSPRGGI